MLRPISAGVVSALAGFTSAFAVVLTGLAAVGATPAQASSGLMAVSLTMGLSSILLAVTTRTPISIAWSTPGAALLATTGAVAGGWPAAVGAFVVTGLLILLTALVPQLGRLIARVPTSVAQAMLAGVLLQICLGPVLGLAANPVAVAPVVLTWLVAARLSPRWATPLAFVVATIVIGVSVGRSGAPVDPRDFVPTLVLTEPAFTGSAAIGLALPLFFVTMASQNIPGIAIMKTFGYHVPWRRTMTVTGVATLVGAPAGGHAINLAAISAALAAGPDAGEDRSRRWIASVTAGAVIIVLGIGAHAFGALVLLAPEGVIPAVAGVALLGTFAASLRGSFEDPGEALPAAVTFVTTASGIAILGISSAFWALVAGLVVHQVLRRHRSSGGATEVDAAPPSARD